LVEDWVNRTICAVCHVALHTDTKIKDADAGLREGVDWLDSAGLPGESSRHTLCVCVL
jgi:hypothetical protein